MANNSNQSSLPTEINILLLGETGVGKSTFINALVNYLIYESLEAAERGTPVVLIPVSFPIAIGDQYEEVTIKFGDVDPNENHQNKGQSVTQHCRSYIFDLNEKLKLRLIDTPGIGDTRGLEQDQININHIFTYINQLSHLNAVCLLLKPNNTKLDMFFRSCVEQLITYLTPSGYQNIVFCFTNSRSSQFSPGNTGSLLKKMLKDKQWQGISWEAKNTFFFDDETFRYLAAKKQSIELGDFVRQESIQSWAKSMNKSIELIKFIITLQSYDFDKNKSLRRAAVDASMLARPLIELLRVTLYNWKFSQNGQRTLIIKTDPVDVEICSHCAETNVKLMKSIAIVQYSSTKSEKATSCHCPHDENHFLIEYTVKHEVTTEQMKYNGEQLQNFFVQLSSKCDTLIGFLRQNGLINETDPFSSVLKRFVDEEKQVRESHGFISVTHNEIYNSIRILLKRRQDNHKKFIHSNTQLSLDEVYDVIHSLMSEPIVKQQLECIKATRRRLMEKTEREVKLPVIRNRCFTEFVNH